jgi:cysteine desulfurase
MLLDLDANATYTPSESLQELVRVTWSRLGNPSSIHRGGQRAKAAIEEAREHVRLLVGARPKDLIIFTSGATEANNTVIASVAASGARLISSTIEHPCILEPLRAALVRGAFVQLAAPNPHGEVTPEAVIAHVDRDTALVSVMAANNETGVVNDIVTIANEARRLAPSALVHTDAAQIIGKMPFRFDESGLDCITLSGHKLGALTGVGALIIREGVRVAPYLVGGSQEAKLRGGTENVLGIASLGMAASEIVEQGVARGTAMQRVRDRFETELVAALPMCEVNGRQANRLPNTSSVYIPGIRADDLVVALDLEGIYISSGAACSSGKPEPSHVLVAMGQSDERVRATVRLSFRAEHGNEDNYSTIANDVAGKMKKIVERMRRYDE